jgi:NAD(P)-dependent dehydrogenase (short-subunit alcohol dehydrogenase family)
VTPDASARRTAPTQPGRLRGKVAIVTGAAAGLGAAICQEFAAQGAAVVCADLDRAGAHETTERILGAGGAALAVCVDVTSRQDTEQMARAACEEFGHCDVLVANAGIPGRGRASTVEPDVWERVLAVNLTGVWLSARAVLPRMLERGAGSIINQASVGGLVGVPDLAPYAASKGGVIALTRQMAADYSPLGIRVNSLCPSTIMTDLVRSTYQERQLVDGSDPAMALREKAERIPLRRLGQVADVASAAVYLASDEASWVTGVVLPVDGGITAV